MNAVEIEEAVSALIEQKFDAADFPFAFLEAYGNKPPTIKRLRTGNTNKTDIDGAVLRHGLSVVQSLVAGLVPLPVEELPFSAMLLIFIGINKLPYSTPFSGKLTRGRHLNHERMKNG